MLESVSLAHILLMACIANFVNHFSVFSSSSQMWLQPMWIQENNFAISNYTSINTSAGFASILCQSFRNMNLNVQHVFETEMYYEYHFRGIIYQPHALPIDLLNTKYTSLWYFQEAAHLTNLLHQQRVCNFE